MNDNQFKILMIFSGNAKLSRIREKYGMVAFGLCIMLLEILLKCKDCKCSCDIKNLNLLAYNLQVDINLLQSLIFNSGLFTIDGDVFYSKELLCEGNEK